jgi:hypothetical protein
MRRAEIASIRESSSCGSGEIGGWSGHGHRGDPRMDAMGAALGMYFRERYGSPMYRVAATFTAVAFGVANRNPRAVRSAVQRDIQRHRMTC